VEKLYASVLLVDDKILFWRVNVRGAKRRVDEFNKDFMYSGRDISDYIDKPNVRVKWDLLETRKIDEWFKQWELVEGYEGQIPYHVGNDWIKKRIGERKSG